MGFHRSPVSPSTPFYTPALVAPIPVGKGGFVFVENDGSTTWTTWTWVIKIIAIIFFLEKAATVLHGYQVQKHRYTDVAEKPVFSSCSCQSCPVVCPLVNCAGCAVRHFNQQWAQAKDTLARVSRGIEHIQVQDAECSSTNRKCIISSSKAPLYTCCWETCLFQLQLSKLSCCLSTCQLRWLCGSAFQSAMGTSKDTLARVSRGIEHIQVQDAECSSTNRKCIISSSKAPLYTCCWETCLFQLQLSKLSCCLSTCQLRWLCGSAFQSAMGTSKDTLARVSRGIEHIQVQDAECSSTNRKCIISSSKAPLYTCCWETCLFQLQLSKLSCCLSTCQLRWLCGSAFQSAMGTSKRHSCQSFPRHWTHSSSRRRML